MNKNSQQKQQNDKASRKRRRAERNKMRTIKHVHKLLDVFNEGIMSGFSNEGWKEMASVYRQLSPFLATKEYNALGHVWRSTWTNEPNQESVGQLINAVKNRISGKNLYTY